MARGGEEGTGARQAGAQAAAGWRESIVLTLNEFVKEPPRYLSAGYVGPQGDGGVELILIRRGAVLQAAAFPNTDEARSLWSSDPATRPRFG